MQLFEALKTRRSIRAYENVPVPKEKLAQVLEAARIAPSAANKQMWKFVVVEDQDIKEKLVPLCRNQPFVGQAGVVIACCCPDKNWKWADVDVSIAVDHMTLAAHALGLGTCWIGAFDPTGVADLLAVPEEAKIVVLLTLGMPAKETAVRPRKDLEEIVSYNKY